MKMYQCVLVENGYVKENFFKEGETAKQVLKDLQGFNYGKGTWKVYLNDELEISTARLDR